MQHNLVEFNSSRDAYGYVYGIDIHGYGQKTTVVVTNAGTIEVEGTKSAYGINAYATSSYSGTVTVDNSGDITAKSDGLAIGVALGYNSNNRAYVTNTGDIVVNTVNAGSGIYSQGSDNCEITNDGNIVIISTATDTSTGNFYGIHSYIGFGAQASISNNETISVTSNSVKAYGVLSEVNYLHATRTEPTNILSNSGDITVNNSGADALGLALSIKTGQESNLSYEKYPLDRSYTATVDNSGTITVTSAKGEAYGIQSILANTANTSSINTYHFSNYGDLNVNGATATHDLYVHGSGDDTTVATIGTCISPCVTMTARTAKMFLPVAALGLEWAKGDTTTSLSYIADFGNTEESHMALLKIEFEF